MRRAQELCALDRTQRTSKANIFISYQRKSATSGLTGLAMRCGNSSRTASSWISSPAVSSRYPQISNFPKREKVGEPRPARPSSIFLRPSCKLMPPFVRHNPGPLPRVVPFATETGNLFFWPGWIRTVMAWVAAPLSNVQLSGLRCLSSHVLSVDPGVHFDS